MPRIAALVLLALGLSSVAAHGDMSGCACDLANPESMALRACALCREAERQSADSPFFFLKDSSPLKPNRWLALPRAHYDGKEPLAKMPLAERTRLWTAAIERAGKLWGAHWGLAINGDRARSQCHAHIHIGKLLTGVETGRFVVVAGPARIPAPREGGGLWIHPQGAKLHVHLGEQTTETVLLR